MPRIKMLKDDKGSQTGSITEEFLAGKSYTVTEDLAINFESTGSAERIADGEEKASGNAPENKDAGSAPADKKKRAK